MTANPTPRVSGEEYVAMEEASETRNELIDGVVVAMSGSRFPHVQIVRNLLTGLDGRLRGKPCQVLSNDLKVKVELTESYFYPDLVGICGKPVFENPSEYTVLNPTILIEVLFPSTEKLDRGKKFMHYQQIPALREYVLVSAVEPVVELYARGENAEWTYRSFTGLDAVAQFGSIDCLVPLSEIYREVEFKGESIE